MKRYRRHLIAGAQALVSVAVLYWIARYVDFSDSIVSLASIPPEAAGIAFAIMGAGFLASSMRWGAMLRAVSIILSARTLFRYYLMGLFFSLFLPTSVGGDAFRIYAVTRASERAGAVFFATVQERLLGLGGAIMVSLAAMPMAAHILPPGLLPGVLLVQLAALVGTVFVISPSLGLAAWRPLSRLLARYAPSLIRWKPPGSSVSLEGLMAKFEVLITSRSQNVAALLLLAVLPAIIISYSYQVILQSIGIETSVAVLMLIVPMVWIVRLLPISLGGIGLGEGAFVLLAALAGMDRERAFAAALAVLGIQIAWSLIGGLLVVRSGLKRAFAAAQPSE